MIAEALLRPRSIAVVGASNNTGKPGGNALKNLITAGFDGPLYPVNPKEQEIQGHPAFREVDTLPEVDLAILAIPAALCPRTIETLARDHGTRGFIVYSAGFSEESEAGAALEAEMRRIVDDWGASLIGPNCIGVLTPRYAGVFTGPVPPLAPEGCDLVSGSGATAVFIMEDGISKGLTFSRVFSVGNSAQLGVEDILEYLDETWDAARGGNPKLLYLESIRNPEKLLTHARSLTRKGCRIAAVKAGASEAGSRAASSHTGALAGSDAAVDALFRKAGIVRCSSREELTTVAGIFSYPPLTGKRIAVVTHAGGPAVMLTDALSAGGLEVPPIEGPEAEQLKARLFPGSSVANPIDFLATGTAEQLGAILDACENEFTGIDGTVVIFGSPGLGPVDDAYAVLHEKIRSGTKPIYPVLPSVVNAGREIAAFIAGGNVAFPDEVALGRALARVSRTVSGGYGEPGGIQGAATPSSEVQIISRQLRAQTAPLTDGYLPPDQVAALLDSVGIPRLPEMTATNPDAAATAARELGYPVVMKVVGPVHKSDVGGVVLGITGETQLRTACMRLSGIPDATGVLIQPMVSGTELFAGVSREGPFGHLLVAGLGGVFVEVLRDVAYGLAPLDEAEATAMIKSLNGAALFTGVRGQTGIGIENFAPILVSLSRLVEGIPEIAELDLNPLIASKGGIVAVDARIRIEGRT
ncbi:MAG: acetate--CoA ligase family protein [Alkalispirochaeta sp.]